MKTVSPLVDLERGRIHAGVFFDPEIYRQEIERVFGRCWLLLCHESEIGEVGDYVTTYMGEDPVIVCRDSRGKVRAYLNFCRHRGSMVCRAERGRTKSFTCGYHMWTYSIDGELVGVPFEDKAYPEGLDRRELALIEVPRVASYKGFIFGCWDERAEALERYLGDFRWYFDILVERALGGWEVVPGVQKCVIECNWKLHSENFAGDMYHVLLTHGFARRPGLDPFAYFGDKLSAYIELPAYVTTFPEGHSMIDILHHGEYYHLDREVAKTLGPEGEEYVEACYRRLREVLSPKQADVYGLGPGLIFPNTAFLDFGCLFPLGIYTFHPKGPEKHEYWARHLVDRAAPAAVKEMLRKNFIWGQSVGGMFTPDDTDGFSRLQEAIRGTVGRKQWLDYHMGLAREGQVPEEERDYPGDVGPRPSERGQRNFYRRWGELLNRSHPEEEGHGGEGRPAGGRTVPL